MSELILRTQPTCEHCLRDDKRSAIIRYVTIQGVSAECAGCGMDLGDAKELTIPANVASIYTTLIKRATMRIGYFNTNLPATEVTADELLFPVTIDQLFLSSRTAHTGELRCTLDWFAFDAQKHQPRDVTPVQCDAASRIETFPAAVALAARTFLHDGFVVIEVPRKGAEKGCIRFRKIGHRIVQSDNKNWEEHTIIRGQLTW